MTCRHCLGADDFFGSATARRDLERYRKKGPGGPTAELIRELGHLDLPDDLSLLDVGGGVGAIQHEIASTHPGARTVAVDASEAYLAAARREAERQGYGDRAEYWHGDFVDLADRLREADLVTLDRVICCYPDMPALVGRSADMARRAYGLVFPRETWWVRIGLSLVNLYNRARRSAFRVYLHDTPGVLSEIESRGFRQVHSSRGLVWQVRLFAREGRARG